MKTLSINIFQFEELSNSAKQIAMQWYRNSDVDQFYAECIFEDAANIAELFGLDIRLTCTNSGNYEPSIYYSGFSSQGDGACFKGSYRYKKGGLKAVKSYAPKDVELHSIVKALQSVQKKHFYKLQATTGQRGHYSNAYCMTVDVSADTYADISQAEDEITELLRGFARWIYKQLEAAHEYDNSDEVVIGNIAANGYEFLASGERA